MLKLSIPVPISIPVSTCVLAETTLSSEASLHLELVKTRPPVQRHVKVDMFMPNRYIHYGPYRLINGLHTGKSSAYCPISNSFSNYVCNDYGQFPWGYSSIYGTMAYICKELRLSEVSGICNT